MISLDCQAAILSSHFLNVCNTRTSVPGIRLVDLNHKNRFCEVPMQPTPWWFVVLLDRITQPSLKQKLPINENE